MSSLEALHAEVDDFHAKALTAEQRAAIERAEGQEDGGGGGQDDRGGEWHGVDLENELDRGTDPQILRDLGPWAARGFTYAQLIDTKKGRTSVGLAPALDPERPRPLFNAWILAGRLYFSTWEANKMMDSYYYPALRKVMAFHELLASVLETAAPGSVPDVLFVWHLDPYPLLGGKPAPYEGVMVPPGGAEDPEMRDRTVSLRPGEGDAPPPPLPAATASDQGRGLGKSSKSRRPGSAGRPGRDAGARRLGAAAVTMDSAGDSHSSGRDASSFEQRQREAALESLSTLARAAVGLPLSLRRLGQGAPIRGVEADALGHDSDDGETGSAWGSEGGSESVGGARQLRKTKKQSSKKRKDRKEPRQQQRGQGKKARAAAPPSQSQYPRVCVGRRVGASCTESSTPSPSASASVPWEAMTQMPPGMANDTSQPGSLAGFGPRWLGVEPRNASTWAVPPAPPGLAPLFALCKTDAHWDVLYPNMYFKSVGNWRQMSREILRAVGSAPWRARLDRLWWRGSMGDMWPGGKPRAVTVGTYASKPWADFAFTENASNWQRVQSTWVASKPWGKSLPPGLATVRHGSNWSMPMTAVAGYRYALHLPGFFMATYSRTLQFLLWSGATIFVYDCPYYEFYYHKLTPWLHYIPVNGTNLPERLAWAQANPLVAARIAVRASRSARRHLNADRVSRYWLDALRVYARLQRFSPLAVAQARSGGLQTLCTCWRGRHGPGVRSPDWVLAGAQHCGLLCSWRLIAHDAAFKKPLFAHAGDAGTAVTGGGAGKTAEGDAQSAAEEDGDEDEDEAEDDDEEEDDEEGDGEREDGEAEDSAVAADEQETGEKDKRKR